MSLLELHQSDCICVTVILKSNNMQPRPYVFGDFGTFLTWRRQNLEDLVSFSVQSIPYICEEYAPTEENDD